MIELTGTEKQIAWANDLRERFIEDAAKTTKMWKDDLAGCIEDGDTQGEEWTRERLEKHTRIVSEILNEVSRAGWWIDFGRGDAINTKEKFCSAKRGATFNNINLLK